MSGISDKNNQNYDLIDETNISDSDANVSYSIEKKVFEIQKIKVTSFAFIANMFLILSFAVIITLIYVSDKISDIVGVLETLWQGIIAVMLVVFGNLIGNRRQ